MYKQYKLNKCKSVFSSSFRLQHIEYKLAVHRILNKFLLGDISVTFLVHGFYDVIDTGSQQILILLYTSQPGTVRLGWIADVLN